MRCANVPFYVLLSAVFLRVYAPPPPLKLLNFEDVAKDKRIFFRIADATTVTYK